MHAIECEGLTKLYEGHIAALSDVTLSVPRGAAFGLLGENSAGKSTLVRLLMGFIFPTSGLVRVLGEEQVARAHPCIGYVHERSLFEPRFTGRSYLTYFAQLSGLWGRANRQRVDEALEIVGLRAAANRPIGGYSKGMAERLAIAQALDFGPLPTLQAIVRAPVLPLAACYTLGGPPGVNPAAIWAVPLVAVYAIALTLLAGFWLAKRDLILH